MVLLRKAGVVFDCMRHCRNWPQVLGARRARRGEAMHIYLRDGITLALDDFEIQWATVFEPAVADVYGIRDGRYDLVLDVGGHVGAFACLAAVRHPDAQVHTFEPQRDVRVQLEQNVEHNDLRNVAVHDAAVTRDGREIEFFTPDNRGAAGLFAQSGGAPRTMRSVSLDGVDWASSRSAFVKLDCEGAEGEILEWVAEHIDMLPPALRMAAEWHPWCPMAADAAVVLLRNCGFRAWTVARFGETYVHAIRSA